MIKPHSRKKYRAQWLRRSRGKALTSKMKDFDSQIKALNFAKKLAASRSNSKVAVQTKVGRAWKVMLRFTSPPLVVGS